LYEELERYLWHVGFSLPSYLRVIVLALIGCLFSQVLALSESQREKRTAESAWTAKNVELEVLANSQAEKITELEAAYANPKHEKETVTAGYRRNIKCLLKRPSGRKWSLWKPMRQSLLNFEGTWIWRLIATPSTSRMFTAGSMNFTKWWLHHLMRFKRGVCPSLGK
jgi:hypothetical protein